tara:strand:- start:289 stop:390 length:102 start_codon:yes stop_codon:yes gene_type:complete
MNPNVSSAELSITLRLAMTDAVKIEGANNIPEV